MSKFLQPPDPILTSEAFIGSALLYILDELKNPLDVVHTRFGDLEKNGEKEVQNIMDKSDHKMRMYGTAKELAENLAVYRNFPESHRFFDMTDSIPYFNTPIIYKSLKDKDFLCKSDLFVILQNMALHLFPEAKAPLLRSMLMIFLKSQESRIKERIEFVRYDLKFFNEIEKELSHEIEKNKKSINRQELSIRHFNDVFSMLQQLIPKEYVNRKESNFWRVELNARSEFVNLSDAETIETLHKNIRIIIKSLQTIIDKRPELFLPQSTTGKGPNAVRLFEDGGHRFMIKQDISVALTTSEMFDAMNPEKGGTTYSTVDIEEIPKEFDKFIEKIEFIRTPILRAKHKAVPIRGPDGNFCILSSDAMFQLFNNLIFNIKFFQRTLKHNWREAILMFQDIQNRFLPNTNELYFISLKEYKEIENLFQFHINLIKSIPVKDVRNAKKDGFTLQNLKNELTHSGIVDLFEEIQDYAQVVYEHVDSVKKEKVLRTCDLFDAIEKCQVICLVNRVPSIKQFLHFQRCCGKVLTLKCSSCIKTPPKSPAKKFKNSTWTFYGLDDVTLSKTVGQDTKHSKKRFYIRTVSSVAIDPDQNRRVFTEEILEILNILTDCEEKLEKYEKEWKTDGNQKLSIGMEELKEVLTDLDIDKARITLIPDLSHSITTLQSMISPGSCSIFIHYDKQKTVMDTSQAVFKIFQSIICDIDWTKDPCKKHQNCLQKYKTTVIGELKKYQAMRDGTYVTVEDVENRVKTLKAYCNYSTRKNLTPPPLVKIFDCDFKDSISLLFFITESKKFGLRYRAPKDSKEKGLEEAILPIWKARLLFMMEWIQMFFGKDEEEELKGVIQKAMMFRAPFSSFQTDMSLMDLIICVSPEKYLFVNQLLTMDTKTFCGHQEQEHEFMKNVKDRKYVIRGKSNQWNSSIKVLCKIVKESEDVPASKAPALTPEGQTTFPKSPDDVKAHIKKGTTEDVAASPKTSQTAVPPQSENCEKCFRTGETLNETKENLKASENKIKKLEKKLEENAKELVETKKSMMEEKKKEVEEKEKEIEELKRNLAENSHITGENDALKLKIQQLESKISELKDNISSQEHTHHKTQNALNEHISQLELNLEAEKEKLRNSRIPDDEKSRFESEIQEKTKQIHEFHEANIRLKAENEVKERMIQQLMNKLAESKKASSYSNHQKYSTPHDTPTCTICRTEMTDSTIKCHQCRIQFHTNCVSQWLRLHKVCPSCRGQFLAPSKNRTFSTFNQ